MKILKQYKAAVFIIISACVLYAFFAWKMPMELCPDEEMRYLIPQWLAVHNSLPIGFEEEIIYPIWGFSYASSPYLPSIIGGFFMRMALLFTSDPHFLLFVCRLVSVVSGVGVVFWCFRIGSKVFDNKASVYLMAVFIGFLPQMVFLCGYFNNDTLSFFSCMLILDAILTARETSWNLKNSLYLAMGISICALTYYYAYGWILFAVAAYFYTAYLEKKGIKSVLKYAGIITLMVLVLAGWYFIRNAVIYDGDLFGLNQSEVSRALYVASGHQISVGGVSAQMMGLSFHQMLYEFGWIRTSSQSLLGYFGYMYYPMRWIVYDLYKIFFYIGLFCIVYFHSFVKINKKFVLGMLFTIAIPVILSAYYSYFEDYQAQGRYLISILPGMIILIVSGYDALVNWSKTKDGVLKGAMPVVPIIALIALIAIFVYVLFSQMLHILIF